MSHDQSIGNPAAGQTKAEMAASPVSPSVGTSNAPAATHQPQPRQARGGRWSAGPIAWLYAIFALLIFALAVSEMGIVGHLLHIYGNSILGWAGLHQLKNTMGLLMFASAFTVVWAMCAFFIPLLFSWAWVFVLSALWIIGSGLLGHSEPFRVGGCGRDPNFPSIFRSNCHEFVAANVIGWWLWGMSFILMCCMLGSLFSGNGDGRKRTMFSSV